MTDGERLADIVEAAVAGSQVLGVLAARAAGAPFEDVMRERVLAPLGMHDTAFHAADTSRLATAYEGLAVSDPPDEQWSRPPRFPDGARRAGAPDRDLTVVVLTQRAADETGMPAACDEVLAAARTVG